MNKRKVLPRNDAHLAVALPKKLKVQLEDEAYQKGITVSMLVRQRLSTPVAESNV